MSEGPNNTVVKARNYADNSPLKYCFAKIFPTQDNLIKITEASVNFQNI